MTSFATLRPRLDVRVPSKADIGNVLRPCLVNADGQRACIIRNNAPRPVLLVPAVFGKVLNGSLQQVELA